MAAERLASGVNSAALNVTVFFATDLPYVALEMSLSTVLFGTIFSANYHPNLSHTINFRCTYSPRLGRCVLLSVSHFCSSHMLTLFILSVL